MNFIILLLLVIAISTFVLAEIMIAYQKYQLRKQYISELDEAEEKLNHRENYAHMEQEKDDGRGSDSKSS